MKYTINTVKIILCLLFLGLPEESLAQQDSLRVLFVGNSYTYFWNMPQSVAAMAKAQNIPIVTRQSTAGGVNWKQHWEGEKDLRSIELIKQGNWDIVVLQDHSLATINKLDEFMEYGHNLAALVKEYGAKPVFYITWARQANPLMQSQITSAYQELAAKTESDFVAVGPAWMQAKQLMPEINLYDPDGSHPSPTGTYLTAALFLKYFSQQSILDVPHRLTSTDVNGEKIYLAIMPVDEAKFLLQLAEDFQLKTIESER